MTAGIQTGGFRLRDMRPVIWIFGRASATGRLKRAGLSAQFAATLRNEVLHFVNRIIKKSGSAKLTVRGIWSILPLRIESHRNPISLDGGSDRVACGLDARSMNRSSKHMVNRRRMIVQGVASMTTGLAGLSHAQGAPESQLLLGSTGAISGPIGAALRGVLAGASLAFDSVNAAGGIAGRRIRLISLDDELKPDRAIVNYNALLQEHKVLALFGCGGSATTAAGAPLVKESGAPMVGGFGVADSARERVAGSAYFVRASSGREAQVLIQHITTLGITKVGMAAFDNPGGKEATALVERALAQQKLPLHYAGAIKGDGSNAKAVAEEIAKAAPQALIMYLVASQASTLVAAARDVGAAPSFYGMSLVPGEVVAKSLGDRMPGLAISQLVPYPWAGADVDANTYRRLAEAANVPIGYPSYEGYINALVMIEALRRAGRDPTRQRLHAVLKTLKLRIAAAMDIDFTGGSPIAGSRFVEMVHVSRDGRFSR